MNRKFVYVGLVLVGVLLGSVLSYALTPSETFYISSGSYPGAPTYTLFKDGTTYFAKNAQGQNVYSGTNASYIIQSAIDNTFDNGTLFFASAIYLLDTYLSIAKPLIILGAGRWSTIFVADGSFDVFKIGTSTGSEFGGVESLYIAHIGIWGKEPLSNRPPYGYADTIYTGGAGIRLIRGFQIILEDLLICRKEYGIAIDVNAGGSVYYLSMDNLSWQYNYYGIYKIGGFFGVAYLTNSQSYLNQHYGLQFTVTYSGMISNYVSEADGWNIPDNTLEIVALATTGNLFARGLHIQGSKGGGVSPARAILTIYVSVGSQIHVSDLTIQSGDHIGVLITGGAVTTNATTTLTNFLIGPIGDGGFMGDPGTIGDWGILSNAFTGLSLNNGYINATNGILISNHFSYYRAGVIVNGLNQSNGWISP